MSQFDFSYANFLRSINLNTGANYTLDQVSFSQAKANTNNDLGGNTVMRLKTKSGSTLGSFLFAYDRIPLSVFTALYGNILNAPNNLPAEDYVHYLAERFGIPLDNSHVTAVVNDTTSFNYDIDQICSTGMPVCWAPGQLAFATSIWALPYVPASKSFIGASVGNTTSFWNFFPISSVDYDMDVSLTAQLATLGRLGVIVAHYKDPDTGKINDITATMFQNGKIYLGFNEGSPEGTLNQIAVITGSSNNSWQGNTTHLLVQRRGDVITVKFYGWTLANTFNNLRYTLTINLNDDSRFAVFKNRPGCGVMMNVAGNQTKFTINSLIGYPKTEAATVTFTAKADNPAVTGSIKMVTRPNAPTLRKIPFQTDYSPRIISTKAFAELYKSPLVINNYYTGLSPLKAGTRYLAPIVAALIAATGDPWCLTKNAPFSLYGARVLYNGMYSSGYKTGSGATYGIVVDLSDACTNLEGQLLIGYN